MDFANNTPHFDDGASAKCDSLLDMFHNLQNTHQTRWFFPFLAKNREVFSGYRGAFRGYGTGLLGIDKNLLLEIFLGIQVHVLESFDCWTALLT